jgi:hypothetical protein
MTEEGWPKEGKKGKNGTDFSTPQRLESRRDFLEPELGGRKETQKGRQKWDRSLMVWFFHPCH